MHAVPAPDVGRPAALAIAHEHNLGPVATDVVAGDLEREVGAALRTDLRLSRPVDEGAPVRAPQEGVQLSDGLRVPGRIAELVLEI